MQPIVPPSVHSVMVPDSSEPRRPLFVLVLLGVAARWTGPLLGGVEFSGLVVATVLAFGFARDNRIRRKCAGAMLFLLLCAAAPRSLDSGPTIATDHDTTAQVLDRERLVNAAREESRSARGQVLPSRIPRVVELVTLPDECVRLRPAARGIEAFWNSLEHEVSACKRRLERRASRLRHERTRLFVRSLVFGEARSLPFEVADLFTRTGTRHLLAVSGLHVSLLFLLLIGPLTAWLPGPSRDVVRLVSLALLVGIAGAHSPVVRAAATFAFARLSAHLPLRRSTTESRALGMTRRGDSLSIWSLALAGECLAAGAAPLSISVRLSYGATLGLILWTGAVQRWLRRYLGLRELPLGSAAKGWMVPLRKLRDGLVSGLAASFAASATTLPFVWREFGEWSPLGMLLTPLILPLFSAVLLFAWIWMLLPCAPFEACLDTTITALIRLLELADRIPGTPWLLPHRPDGWLVCSGVATLVAGLSVWRGQRAGVAGRGALLLTAIGLVPWTSTPMQVEVHLLDVGHGTASVVRAPGGRVWIFDAGSKDRARVAQDAVLPLLATWETPCVSILVSHADRDHCSALPRIATRLEVEQWIGPPPSECGVRLDERAALFPFEHGQVRLFASEELSLTLLRTREETDNESSASLWIETPAGAVLLCGDAEDAALENLCDELAMREPLARLLLPHHGSDGPRFGRLLEAARPREVWVSSGALPPTAGELERRGLRWRCTARAGPLCFPAPRSFP